MSNPIDKRTYAKRFEGRTDSLQVIRETKNVRCHARNVARQERLRLEAEKRQLYFNTLSDKDKEHRRESNSLRKAKGLTPEAWRAFNIKKYNQ
jgi:hypothetical protein